MIDQAVVLAAGFGRRLRPYTDAMPKPLVRVQGEALMEPALAMLEDAGVKRIAVNTHYKAEMVQDYLSARESAAQIVISHEEEILDTGGGINKARSKIADEPFFVMSGDSILLPGPGGNPLRQMRACWNAEEMDIMILLIPVAAMKLTCGLGDYDLDEKGAPIRRADKSGRYMWTSARICHPRIFKDAPSGPFSFLPLLDRAEQAGRLSALVHDGRWLHISMPEDLERVNAQQGDLHLKGAAES